MGQFYPFQTGPKYSIVRNIIWMINKIEFAWLILILHSFMYFSWFEIWNMFCKGIFIWDGFGLLAWLCKVYLANEGCMLAPLWGLYVGIYFILKDYAARRCVVSQPCHRENMVIAYGRWDEFEILKEIWIHEWTIEFWERLD